MHLQIRQIKGYIPMWPNTLNKIVTFALPNRRHMATAGIALCPSYNVRLNFHVTNSYNLVRSCSMFDCCCCPLFFYFLIWWPSWFLEDRSEQDGTPNCVQTLSWNFFYKTLKQKYENKMNHEQQICYCLHITNLDSIKLTEYGRNDDKCSPPCLMKRLSACCSGKYLPIANPSVIDRHWNLDALLPLLPIPLVF